MNQGQHLVALGHGAHRRLVAHAIEERLAVATFRRTLWLIKG